MAAHAEMTIDKFMSAIAEYDSFRRKQHDARASNEEERTAIINQLKSLNGALSPDTPIMDVLANAGVRRNIGTAIFARKELQRQLLTHQPSAE